MDRVNGIVTGIVTNVDDPEGEGRVELRFPWMPGEIRSSWAPVAAPLAGPSRGFYFSPEVDDEVLVAFEHGDFDHPFVLGYLWNGIDRPPETERKNRVILTPGGHTLRFEDADPRKLILQSSSGHKLEFDDTPGAAKISIASAAGQTILIDDAALKIEVNGGGRVVTFQGEQLLIS